MPLLLPPTYTLCTLMEDQITYGYNFPKFPGPLNFHYPKRTIPSTGTPEKTMSAIPIVPGRAITCSIWMTVVASCYWSSWKSTYN